MQLDPLQHRRQVRRRDRDAEEGVGAEGARLGEPRGDLRAQPPEVLDEGGDLAEDGDRVEEARRDGRGWTRHGGDRVVAIERRLRHAAGFSRTARG